MKWQESLRDEITDGCSYMTKCPLPITIIIKNGMRAKVSATYAFSTPTFWLMLVRGRSNDGYWATKVPIFSCENWEWRIDIRVVKRLSNISLLQKNLSRLFTDVIDKRDAEIHADDRVIEKSPLRFQCWYCSFSFLPSVIVITAVRRLEASWRIVGDVLLNRAETLLIY